MSRHIFDSTCSQLKQVLGAFLAQMISLPLVSAYHPMDERWSAFFLPSLRGIALMHHNTCLDLNCD